MQSVVHDSGISQDPPCKQKLLAFKFASDALLEANLDVVGGADGVLIMLHNNHRVS
jgi:hypothetical protein